jgi:hypothetical protein
MEKCFLRPYCLLALNSSSVKLRVVTFRPRVLSLKKSSKLFWCLRMRQYGGRWCLISSFSFWPFDTWQSYDGIYWSRGCCINDIQVQWRCAQRNRCLFPFCTPPTKIGHSLVFSFIQRVQGGPITFIVQMVVPDSRILEIWEGCGQHDCIYNKWNCFDCQSYCCTWRNCCITAWVWKEVGAVSRQTFDARSRRRNETRVTIRKLESHSYQTGI